MIAVDTNVLVYSHRADNPFHIRAREVIEGLRSSSRSWAIPWPCLHEFVGIVTNPKIFKNPTSLEAGFASIDAWLAGGNLHLIGESEGYLEKLRKFASEAKLQGARIHDARIAAFASTTAFPNCGLQTGISQPSSRSKLAIRSWQSE